MKNENFGLRSLSIFVESWYFGGIFEMDKIINKSLIDAKDIGTSPGLQGSVYIFCNLLLITDFSRITQSPAGLRIVASNSNGAC